jgi:ABC-type phosphate transport system substrate-binding protein
MRALACVALTLALGWLAGGAACAEEIAVIVHRERTVSLTRDQLAQIYMKTRRHWAGGDAILPVNREPESRIREEFTRAIFRETPEQLRIYWNRQYFLAVLPPATVASDRAMLAFVATEKRAIGYVRASAVDDSVRVVMRIPVATASPPGRAP